MLQSANAGMPQPTEERQEERQNKNTLGLKWYWHLLALVISIAIIYSRQPDILRHPQFIAEDGKVWFADAYNSGWFRSLFVPYNGYFQTLPRLAAAFAVLVPLQFAPSVMALVGLAVQILPVFILLSSRLENWGPLTYRALLAIGYLALPNSHEINVIVTNAQWHMALAAFLLIAGQVAATRFWRYLDLAVFLLCGLTGPFVILLLPFVWLLKNRRALPVLCGCAVIQIGALLLFSPERGIVPHGSPLWIVKILAGHIYAGAAVGHNTLALTLSTPALLWLALIGSVIIAICLLCADLEVKTFAAFAALVLAASFLSPAVSELEEGLTSWRVMAGAHGVRYWFFPTLAIFWSVISMIAGKRRTDGKQLFGCLFMLLLLFGVVRDWRTPPRPDSHFEIYAQRFSMLKTGELLSIPEADGEHWTMVLRRRK